MTSPAAQDLGARPIGRLLWHNCSQTTLSVGVYGIYALTNAWFVAWGVGEAALAAVNLVAPLLLLLGAVSTTVGVGGASLVSRSLGRGDSLLAARAAGNTFVLFWVTALATTTIGLVALDRLLTLLGASSQTLEYARPYATVILLGAIVSTGFSSLMRAEGRIFSSTLQWIVPVIVQIALDPLFIFVLHLGVTGAALGTVGGQVVSAAMSFWFFFLQKDRPYRVGLRDMRLRADVAGEVLSIGAPSFLTGLGATVLAVVINHRLAVDTVHGGAVALAAFAVCSRIQTFVVMPQTGITQGTQPVIGYNTGRRLYERVLRARTLSLRATAVYGALAATTVAAAAEPLVQFFLPAGSTADLAVFALRIIAVSFLTSGIPLLVAAYFQSIGRALPSYLISIGSLLIIKLPLVLTLPHVVGLGTTGVWIALPAGEALSAIGALMILRAADKRATR